MAQTGGVVLVRENFMKGAFALPITALSTCVALA